MIAALLLGLAPALAWPVACEAGKTCFVQSYADADPGPGAKDYRCGPRSYQAHDGTDIRLPSMAAQRAGVAVKAAAAGRVLRVRDGVADVSVRDRPVAEGQDCGNGVVVDHGGGWETQYCHLAQGSIAVKPGQSVPAGGVLGRIGLSGNTEFPHLHLTVREQGRAVDPFAHGAPAGTCGAGGRSLWAATPAYLPGALLQAGFAAGPVTMAEAQDGRIARPDRASPALVFWAQAIGLEGGDVQRLRLTGPDGAVIAESALPPLDRAKAQTIAFAGRKARGGGWPAGRYAGRYTVTRAGRVVIQRDFGIDL